MSKRAVLGLILLSVVLLAGGCINPIRAVRDWIRGEEVVGDELYGGSETDIEHPGDSQADARMRETVLYYRDGKGYLVPVLRNIEWTEGIARAVLEKTIEDDADADIAQRTGLYSAIPRGTRILGITIRDGLAKVDLSDEALGYDNAEDEELMLKSVVYTLTEFNTVDDVQFMFGGKILDTLRFGNSVGTPIGRENINLVGDAAGSRVTVYFCGENQTGFQYFVPVTLNVGTAGDNMDVAVKCLLEGPPKGSGLFSPIPPKARVKGMGVKNGVVYLNFEDGIFDYQGSDRTGESIVKCLALTLKEYPSVVGVKFLVDEEPASLPNGIVLENTIDVPVFANEYD